MKIVCSNLIAGVCKQQIGADAFETALESIGEEYAVTGTIDEGVFQRAALMTGLKEFLISLYEKPSFARELLKKHYEFALEMGKCFLDAGAEFILVGDDIADNHGPLLSPKLYEEFVYPHHKALVHSLKKRGAKVIWDTDGNVMPILNYLLDMGIDGLHPIEPTGGMNIVELQRKYRDRLCVVGGVDVEVTAIWKPRRRRESSNQSYQRSILWRGAYLRVVKLTSHLRS